MSDSTDTRPAALRVTAAFGEYAKGDLISDPAVIAAIHENGQQRMTVAVAAEPAKADHAQGEG